MKSGEGGGGRGTAGTDALLYKYITKIESDARLYDYSFMIVFVYS